MPTIFSPAACAIQMECCSMVGSYVDSYAAEIARLEETRKEQEAAAHELDSMLHAGGQALERLRLIPNKEKRRFVSACGLQVALFPVSPGPRFKLLWRLAYVQVATLQTPGKQADGTPPEAVRQGSAGFNSYTKIGPRPSRSSRRVR
jgi:hypothetical protein